MADLAFDDLRMVLRFPRTCDAEVTHGWELDPCGRTAVAIALDPESHPYPVCKHHARGRDMVALADLFDALEVYP